MLSGYGSTPSINSLLFLVRDRLWTSESDVYRRQILTSKFGPRAESVILSGSLLFLFWKLDTMSYYLTENGDIIMNRHKRERSLR